MTSLLAEYPCLRLSLKWQERALMGGWASSLRVLPSLSTTSAGMNYPSSVSVICVLAHFQT